MKFTRIYALNKPRSIVASCSEKNYPNFFRDFSGITRGLFESGGWIPIPPPIHTNQSKKADQSNVPNQSALKQSIRENQSDQFYEPNQISRTTDKSKAFYGVEDYRPNDNNNKLETDGRLQGDFIKDDLTSDPSVEKKKPHMSRRDYWAKFWNNVPSHSEESRKIFKIFDENNINYNFDDEDEGRGPEEAMEAKEDVEEDDVDENEERVFYVFPSKIEDEENNFPSDNNQHMPGDFFLFFFFNFFLAKYT